MSSTEKSPPVHLSVVRAEQEKAIVPVEELTYLSEGEKYAYNYFVSHRGQGASNFPIATSAQEALYQLYLNGRTCSEIRQANPHFGLGQIVFACVDGDWESRKVQHMEEMMSRVGDRVRQVTVEGANFASDLMAVTHLMWQEAINKFIATRDPKVIEELGLGIGSIKTYRELVDLLSKLTGQDQKKSISGIIEHHVSSSPPPSADAKSQLAQWAAEKTPKGSK